MNFLTDPTSSFPRQLRALVVDPDAGQRADLAQLITEQGLEAIEVESAEQAVRVLDSSKPDLVITELSMPGMDGMALTKMIKQQQGNRFIPIILSAGMGEDELIAQSIDSDWDSFIRRPYSPALLKGKINAMLRIASLHRRNRELIEQRQEEERIAEQLFSRAVERANVDDDRLCLYKSPAETFSGDVVLSARRLDGTLFFLLGDFTGHGLTTTIGALPLSETFRAMVNKGYDSRQILEQINRKLCKLLPSNMFLALALALVSVSADGKVATVWNAGLPDVLLLRVDGSIDRVVSDHPPLGILKSLQEPHFYSTTLEFGDRIMVYSDGVVEARSLEDELFGEERLIECCAAVASGERVMSSLKDDLRYFTVGQIQFDDISMIEFRADVVQVVEPLAYCPVDGVSMDSGAGSWHWSLELQGQDLAKVNPVALAMNQLQECEGHDDKWSPVYTVLTELYVNALDHGVLSMDSAQKHSAEGFMEYFRIREERLDDLSVGSVQISMQMTRQATGRRLDIWVSDSGAGFDVPKVLAKQPQGEQSVSLMGRGISLVSAICSQLNYFDGGTGAHAVFEVH